MCEGTHLTGPQVSRPPEVSPSPQSCKSTLRNSQNTNGHLFPPLSRGQEPVYNFQAQCKMQTRSPLFRLMKNFKKAGRAPNQAWSLLSVLPCTDAHSCTPMRFLIGELRGREISSVETSLHICLNENLDIVKHYNTAPSQSICNKIQCLPPSL